MAGSVCSLWRFSSHGWLIISLGWAREWRQAAARKGERRKKINGASETFIVKQRVLGSWLCWDCCKSRHFSAGRVGIGFPCQSGADGWGMGRVSRKGSLLWI